MNALMIGLVLGHVHYPACFGPPEDMVVCAERSDGERRCTEKLTPTEEGFAYALELPAGRYRVYATTEEHFPGYRAYYTEAVRCGLSIGCDDHEPIEIEVGTGKTIRGIDPDDWYVRPYSTPTARVSLSMSF